MSIRVSRARRNQSYTGRYRDDFSNTTDADGTATIIYGPKTSPQIINFNTYPVENASIGRSGTIEFYDPSPVYMGATAIPELLPSLDVANMNTTIKAKVTDMKGKPVQGETVTFEIIDRHVQSGTQTAEPYLVNPYLNTSTNITDINGFGTTDWHSLPHQGILSRSPLVIAVRPGNPLGIADWADLARPGVRVVHADPGSSGGAQ